MSGNGVVEPGDQLRQLRLSTDERSLGRIALGSRWGDQVERRILVQDRLVELAQLT